MSITAVIRDVLLDHPGLPTGAVQALVLERLPASEKAVGVSLPLVLQARRTLPRALLVEATATGIDAQKLVRFLRWCGGMACRDVAAILENQLDVMR